MFISLRESCATGFKRWSDLQQQKYGDDRATNVNTRIGFQIAGSDALNSAVANASAETLGKVT